MRHTKQKRRWDRDRRRQRKRRRSLAYTVAKLFVKKVKDAIDNLLLFGD